MKFVFLINYIAFIVALHTSLASVNSRQRNYHHGEEKMPVSLSR